MYGDLFVGISTVLAQEDGQLEEIIVEVSEPVKKQCQYRGISNC